MSCIEACPEFILPDDPPEMKPNEMKIIKMEEFHTTQTSSLVTEDDPLDIKVDLSRVKVKDEPGDLNSTSSSSDNSDEPASATPGLTMSVEIKEENVGTGASTSADQGVSRDKIVKCMPESHVELEEVVSSVAGNLDWWRM